MQGLTKSEYVETDAKRIRLAQNLAVSEKFAILIQSDWSSSNFTYSWAKNFKQVS